MRSASSGAFMILGLGALAHAIPPPEQVVVGRRNANALDFSVILEPARRDT